MNGDAPRGLTIETRRRQIKTFQLFTQSNLTLLIDLDRLDSSRFRRANAEGARRVLDELSL